MKYTVAVGGPSSGFTLNGIFDFGPEAVEDGEDEFASQSWSVMPINVEGESEEETEHRIERMASALAISEGYDPNDVPVNEWAEIRHSYEERAQKILTVLETEENIDDGDDPLEQPDEDEVNPSEDEE